MAASIPVIQDQTAHAYEGLIGKRALVEPGTVWARFNGVTSRRLGITQIFMGLGILSTSLAATGTSDRDLFIYAVGYGIWASISFIVCGSLGVAVAHRKTTTMLNGLLGTSITSSFLSFGVIVWSLTLVFSVYEDTKLYETIEDMSHTNTTHHTKLYETIEDMSHTNTTHHSDQALLGVQMYFSFVEFITSTWMWVLCSYICAVQRSDHKLEHTLAMGQFTVKLDAVYVPQRNLPMGTLSDNFTLVAPERAGITNPMFQGAPPSVTADYAMIRDPDYMTTRGAPSRLASGYEAAVIGGGVSPPAGLDTV